MSLIDFAVQANLCPLRITQGGEHQSACPECGGKDRFIMQPHKIQKNCKGFYWCRKCNASGDTIKFAMKYCGYTFAQATEALGIDLLLPHELLPPSQPALSLPSRALHNSKWIEQAGILVERAHQGLLRHPEMLEYLAHRGISLKTVQECQLGYIPQFLSPDPAAWGLDSQEKFWIAPGIIIPHTDTQGRTLRIKIRTMDPARSNYKYLAVRGGFSGMYRLGPLQSSIVIVVESELDACALHGCINKRAIVIAVGGCSKRPDPIAHYIAQNSSLLLICHDNDAAGAIMFNKWRSWYPHAIPSPTPREKDIGEAFAAGLNLNDWISTLIEQKGSR